MFFLNPSFLLGLIGLSVPIVIHMIARRKRERVLFPSLRFLSASQRRVGRALNLRQFILLFLRLLLLTSLVFAFARPMSTGGWFASLLGAESRQAIFIMDTSYSMSALSGAEPIHQRARNAALAILDSFGPGSRTAVIACDRTARLLTPGWTADRMETRQILSEFELSAGETNIAPSLSLLPHLLKNSSAGAREVFLFTDLQASGWDHVDPQAIDEANLRFLIIDCAQAPAPNAAIDSLDLSLTKTLKNVPARIHANIKNYGETELTPRCSLFVQNKKISEQRLYIPAGAAAEVQFEFTPSAIMNNATNGAENLHGYLSLTADGLELDNRRYFTARLPKTLNVVITDPQADSDRPASHYLSRALAPPGADLSVIQPKIVKQLTQADLINAQAAILTAIYQTPPDEWLEEWVRNGGVLIVFINDENPQAVQLPPILSGIRILPGDSISNVYARMTRAEGLDDTVSALLMDTQFFQTTALLADSSDPSILVRSWFNDGRPSVVQKQIGQGSLLLLAIPCDARWTDFPLQISYLPFIHEILALVLKEDYSQFQIGDPFWFVSESDSAEITSPNNGKILYDPNTSMIPPISDEPGIYHVAIQQNGATQELTAAVNLNAKESNPEQLDKRILKTLIPDAQIISAGAVLKAPKQNAGVGEWTDLFFLLALILLIAEFILSGWFSVPRAKIDQLRRRSS